MFWLQFQMEIVFCLALSSKLVFRVDVSHRFWLPPQRALLQWMSKIHLQILQITLRRKGLYKYIIQSLEFFITDLIAVKTDYISSWKGSTIDQYVSTECFKIMVYSKCKRNLMKVQKSYSSMLLQILPKLWWFSFYKGRHNDAQCLLSCCHGHLVRNMLQPKSNYIKLGISSLLDKKTRVLCQVCWWMK